MADARYLFRTTDDVLADLKAVAAREGRSSSTMLDRIVRFSLLQIETGKLNLQMIDNALQQASIADPSDSVIERIRIRRENMRNAECYDPPYYRLLGVLTADAPPSIDGLPVPTVTISREARDQAVSIIQEYSGLL